MKLEGKSNTALGGYSADGMENKGLKEEQKAAAQLLTQNNWLWRLTNHRVSSDQIAHIQYFSFIRVNTSFFWSYVTNLDN